MKLYAPNYPSKSFSMAHNTTTKATSVILLLLSLSPSHSLFLFLSLFFFSLSLSGHCHKQVLKTKHSFSSRVRRTQQYLHMCETPHVCRTLRSTFKKRNSEIRQTGRIKALHSQRTWLWNLLVPQTSLRQTQVAPPTDNGLAPPPMKSATSVATTSSAIVESMNWQQNRVSTKRYCCAMTEQKHVISSRRSCAKCFMCVRASYTKISKKKYIYIYIYTHMHTIHEYESLSNVTIRRTDQWRIINGYYRKFIEIHIIKKWWNHDW